MENQEYLDYLIVTGKVPRLKGYEDVIKSDIDLKRYHETILQVKMDFKDELLLLEKLYKLYQKESKEINAFVIGLKDVLEKYKIYNADNEIMWLEFRKNMEKLVKLFFRLGYTKDLKGKMLKALKIQFRPSIVRYDKLYRVLYTNDISGFAIQDNNLNIIKDKIGMIIYHEGKVRFHEINIMNDRYIMWKDIKKNIDSYDYVCVDIRCKIINLHDIVNYLYDDRDGIDGLYGLM